MHNKNLGYGANQKTCYKEALKDKDSVIVMLHPDNQYDPKLAVSLASMVASGVYDCAIASRVLLNSAWRSKMPRYKYFFNRLLTNFQNLLLKKNYQNTIADTEHTAAGFLKKSILNPWIMILSLTTSFYH